MKKIVVSVRDLKAKYYLFLLHFNNAATAQRWYSEVVSNPQSQFNKHPRDFALHQLATFDEETGELVPKLMEDLTPYETLDRIQDDRRRDKAELVPSSAQQGPPPAAPRDTQP